MGKDGSKTEYQHDSKMMTRNDAKAMPKSSQNEPFCSRNGPYMALGWQTRSQCPRLNAFAARCRWKMMRMCGDRLPGHKACGLRKRCIQALTRDGTEARRDVPVTALPSDWLQQQLLKVAGGLIPRSRRTLLPSDSAWIAPVMKHFHLGMVERLVEVLRRRMRVMELAAPPPSDPAPSSGPPPLTPAQRASQLTVAELRTAETRPPSPRRPVPPPQPRILVERQKRSVALVLHMWVKEHRFLKTASVEQGESSVALLI